MAKKVRSARGVVVDFDLLKVKQQIAESPTIDVAARENFVEKRLRRRTKRTAVVAVAKPVVEDPIDVELEAEFDPEVESLPTDEPADAAPTRRAAKPIRKNS